MSETTHNTNPANIDISKSAGVTIEWADGHKSQYDLAYLREHCPCAMCTNAEKPRSATASTALPLFKPRPKIQEVEPVGRYALRFYWNDGHSTGIYSYEHLRSICPCPECRQAA